MPNNNNQTSNILQGLIAALAIGNKIRDPNKNQRDRLTQLLQSNPDLIQQYKDQDNPDIAKTLAGMKPRFGPSGGYDQLTSLINNAQASPDTIRKNKIKDIYKQADQDKTAAAGFAPFNPLGASALANSDAVQSADEFTRTGKIDSPDDRQIKQLRMAEQTASTQRALGETKLLPFRQKEQEALTQEAIDRAALSRQQVQDKQDEKDRIAKARAIALPAVARVSATSPNIYKAVLDGKFTGDEVNAMYVDPNISARLRNDREIYADMEGKRMGEAQRAEMMYKGAAEDLFKDAMDAGHPIGMNQAIAYAKNPQAAMQDPNIAEAIKGRLDYNKKKLVPVSRARFLSSAMPIINEITKNQDGEPTDEQIQNLNTLAQTSYAGTMMVPPVFGLSDVTDSKTKEVKREGFPGFRKNKQALSIVGGDPELIQDYKGVVPVNTPAPVTNTPLTLQQKHDNFESLKVKYPKETAKQIQARVEKGES